MNSIWLIIGGGIAAIVAIVVFLSQSKKSMKLSGAFSHDTTTLSQSNDTVTQFADQDDGIIGAVKIIGQQHHSSFAASQASPTNVASADPEDTIEEMNAQLSNLMLIYIAATDSRQFCGYDLMQSLLGAGLQTGADGLLHCYDHSSGIREVLFSVASVIEPGTINMDDIGAFSTPGLCLYIETHKNRYPLSAFNRMLSTARYLADELQGSLFDIHRKPWSTAWEEKCRVAIQRVSFANDQQILH